MDHPQEIDDYWRESIECLLGLPLSKHTLQSKIRASEATQRHIRDNCFKFKSELMEKDATIESYKMNEHKLKKCTEENLKWVTTRSDLLTRRAELYNACLSSQHDLKTAKKAKEAESRVHDLEDEKRNVLQELMLLIDGKCDENLLVDELISSLINKDEVASTAHSFLEANSGFDACEKMLEIWDSLEHSTHIVLALASEVKNLENDKDILRNNLIKAEDEVTVLFDEHNILDTENASLINLLDPRGTHSNR